MNLKLWELDTLKRYRVVNPDGYFFPKDTENLIEYDHVGEWVYSTSPELCFTDCITWGIILTTDFEEVKPNNETTTEVIKKLDEMRDILVKGKQDRLTDMELIGRIDYITKIINKLS